MGEYQQRNITMGMEDAMETKKSFGETVNGIEIKVAFYEDSGDYELYLPQVEMGGDDGLPDQVIRISDSAEAAEAVFNEAKRVAPECATPAELYKKMEAYISENV